MQARLSDLKPGSRARVVRVALKGPAGRRYREMGLIPGEVVKVVRVAPLGDPVEIEVKGYRLSMRKDEASQVIVEVLE
ncbi:FeoA family protein [Stetteria hydrogenophila]